MRRRTFFFLCALLFGFQQVTAQTAVWSQFTNSPTGSARHDDICFISPTHGWTARGRDGIYKTSDGGKTWSKVLTNSTTHFRSIGFVSELVGFAGNLGPGSYDTGVTDNNLLYRTDDGGTNWTVVPGINNSGMKGFCALHVLDSQHIFGGGRVRGPAHFVKSGDGGLTWTVLDLTQMGILGGVMDIHFKDPMNGFIVGMDTNAYNSCTAPYYRGAIARTTNGGLNWTVVANSGVNCSYFWKMSWPSTNVGYASLQQNGSSSSIIFFKTINGGETWTSNAVPYSAIGVASFFVQGIGFLNENVGWLGGASATAPYADNFLHTLDGGASWTPAGYNDSRSINKIRIYPTFAVASGRNLHVYRVPLAITTHPQSRTNAVGSSAFFMVTAHGSAPLTYQWRLDGISIAGATETAYTIGNVQAGHAGQYDVVVSDISGSITSSVARLTVEGVVIPPSIVMQPQNQTVGLGANAAFAVEATGTSPLKYQWLLNETNLTGEISATLIRTNIQIADAGNYSVVVSNSAGIATSSTATLTVIPQNACFFKDDFDSYPSPMTVTSAGTANGYRIFFGAASGSQDFKAIFGFDYSMVTLPTNIPSAPNSIGGTTKGLFLAVNKNATPAAAAVNLYPIGVAASNDFSLKLDMWLNWTNLNSSTEHALFGINHSGSVMNRVLQNTSDGLFFAISGDGDVPNNSATIRDYSVFRGGGAGAAPILMLTNNTVFGPTPLLGSQFDNSNAGFVNLFPSKPMPGFTTQQGSPGLGWVQTEVRQENGLITCLLNGVAIAQYTNAFSFTNGTILLGYNDTYESIGNTNNFLLIDNIRLERSFPGSISLIAPHIDGNNFQFSFATEPYASYTLQWTTNLAMAAWGTFTNMVGNGSLMTVVIPMSALPNQQYYFRMSRP